MGWSLGPFLITDLRGGEEFGEVLSQALRVPFSFLSAGQHAFRSPALSGFLSQASGLLITVAGGPSGPAGFP